jgi:hypothetical protein
MAALHSFRADWMQYHPVSPLINSPDVDVPQLRAPVAAPA